MTWRLTLGLAIASYMLPLEAGKLTYNEAVQIAEEQNRPLKGAEAELQIQLAEAWQVGLLPNPLFTFEIDDFGGSKLLRGFKHAEYTWSLTQPIDLSGKRSARQEVALAAVCKSYWTYQALKQNMRRHLHEAFVEMFALQEHLKIMEKLAQISRDALTCTSEKAASGKVPHFQQKRAEIACYTSGIALEKARADLQSAKGDIAILLGEACPDFDEVAFPFFSITPPLPISSYEDNLENNPELASARMDVYAASQAHKLEKANRIPDLDVTAGYNYYNGENDGSFLIEFSIPLPIFDQNHGNICRASWQTWQANYMQQDLEIQLRSRLLIAHSRLKQAFDAAVSLQGDINACAKETLDSAQESYKMGKIELLELLDAHKTCGEIHDQYIESVKEYHLRRIEVENIAPACGA